MQQLRENRVQLRLGQKLYHHYREYVQFLNDFIICRPYTSMFILLPNIVMIMELSVHFSHTTTGDSSTQISTFFNNVSYLGISSAIIQLINISSILRYTIMTVILLLLLSPLITIAQILILTVFSTNHKKEIGHYRKLYQSSLIHKFIRVFIATFEYVAMPVFTSVGMKLSMSEVEDGMANVTVGTLVLILVPIVYVLGEYHLLEIIDDNDSKPEQQQSLILSRINFPNNILDSILVYLYLILINKLTQSYPFIIAIIIYLVRIFIAAYFKYYQPGVLKEQLFILISSLVTILGLFIAYLCKEIYIVMLCVVVLLVLINRVKDKVSMNGHKQYDLLQNQEKTVEELKRDLWRNGTFTYVFRELIFLSRKSNSHRKQLLIEILKVKCYQLESKSRGGAKMTNTEDLLKFQNLFVNFLGNMLLIGDNSISILRLLQNKDPKREIFAHQVKLLVNRINQNKQIVARMREINDISSQGLVLMKIMFNQFYNDLEFVKDMEQKSRMHITSLAQKQVKTRLFNKKTTAIFINILDQPGKITRVSKNLPAVLGHSPSDLLGKSINEIIPFTIQPFHDQNLIKFVQKYSKKTMRSDPRIQFFAYNKDFHLQQCVIRYNFVMSFFSSFELSGVMRKIQEENKNVILMNEDGVLEGWTEQLASVFNFDEFQTGECLKFNVLSLFPSLIKYNEAGGCNIKTVFFRSGKVKQKALQITQYRNLKGRQLQQKQMYTFKHLLQTDELIQAYLADVQYQLISFCHDKAKMKKIVIKNFERIENFNQIQDNILKTLNGEKLDDNDEDDLDQKELDKDVSMSEYSMAGDQNQKAKIIDSNFTLDFTKPHAFKKQEIRLQSQVSKSQLSIELTDVNHMQEDHLINDEINANAAQQQGNDSLIEASFSPKLQTQTNFIPFLIFIALCFIGIITWDQVVLSNTETLMKKQCTNVINRNRALMIYAKSSFNPNASYIREFDNGKLMEVSTFLGNQNFNYKTFLGDTIIENRFYMFNIQIPSTLDRILMTPNDTKRAQYQKEIEYNFYDVMQAWIERFTESDQEWASTISSVRSNFTIRLIIISIGSIAFSLFLIYIYMQYRKQKKMTEAFFKFQKIDLDEKMAAIRKVIKNLQIKAMQWHLDKEFYDFIKKKDITNLQFEMQTNPCETKIKFETSQQAEQKLAKKKLYSVVLFIAVFLLTQILFIILYSVLNFSQIDNFETIPQQLNKACKLIVLPNLMLANMFYTVPENMLTGYKSIQTQVLEKPLQSVPELFNLLEDAPCMDCQFMYPLLTTNFRSFYSTFEQVINQKTLNNDKNITQLFYAVDVVVQRVTQSLTLQTLMFLPATVFLYIFSLTVFFLSIYFNVRKMIEENEKLEVFLKYFDEEILVKNKHMNGLLNKNT